MTSSSGYVRLLFSKIRNAVLLLSSELAARNDGANGAIHRLCRRTHNKHSGAPLNR